MIFPHPTSPESSIQEGSRFPNSLSNWGWCAFSRDWVFPKIKSSILRGFSHYINYPFLRGKHPYFWKHPDLSLEEILKNYIKDSFAEMSFRLAKLEELLGAEMVGLTNGEPKDGEP